MQLVREELIEKQNNLKYNVHQNKTKFVYTSDLYMQIHVVKTVALNITTNYSSHFSV